ncbi:uncharacterized protein LOC124457513 [Xenia sp. Carnegie-2017]|uniref:uncharacterized protein LOC124457513 n=1 Tax=Xenia sp. Carnegie-2017 TaxID=2897299 RepID=UPI001F038ABB|nr:uncharacterized protein LOC124457513 [Xenia sp. Carnegie-2017]
MDFIQTQFQKGDASLWDCSALFDAILNSISIGKKLKTCEKDVWDAVSDLRFVRNTIVHKEQSTLSDNEFQDFVGKIEKSFVVLKFSQTEMNEIKAQRNLSNSFCVLPSKPNHFVVERTELRDQIINDLEKLSKDNNNGLTYFFISGNPGSGKSQLARKVLEKKYKSWNFEEGASFVFPLDGKDEDSLLKTYRELCYRLNCDKLRIKEIMEEKVAITDKAKNLQSLVCAQIDFWEKWWIIVDNVVQLDEIDSMLPEIGEPKWINGQIILTVQNTDAIPDNIMMCKHISISQGMNSDECLQLLKHYNKNENVKIEILKEVINTLDSQPLALAAAGYYVSSVNKANKTFSWNDYLKELSSGKQEKMNDTHTKINHPYPRTMFQATFLAVRVNAKTSPLLEKIFRFFSLVSFDPIPQDIINQYIQSFDNTEGDEDQALVFAHCSLFLYSESNDIRLHRVVHDAIIDYTWQHSHVEKIMELGHNTSFSQNSLCQVVQALYNFKGRDDQIKLIPHLNLFLEHLQTYKFKLETNNLKFLNYFLSMLRFFGKHYITLKYLEKFEEEAFEFNSDVKAWCFTELGYSYDSTGQFCKAEIFFKKALESRKEIFGEIHADVASSLNDLGLLYRRTGSYKNAKKVHEKALEIRKQLFDPDHVDIATSLMNLGRVYDRTGEYDKAKEVQRKAVEIREKLLPQDQADLADALNHLGLIYDKTGEYEKAKEVHTKSADIREKVLGPDHPDVATSLSNLGLIYDKIGDYLKAEEVHTKAIKIQEHYFGIDHPEVAMSLNNLGFIYDKTGKYDKAKEVHKRALKIREESLSPNHVDVAWSLSSLGFVYEKTGEYDKGIEAQQRSVEIRKKALGPDHPDVATSLNGLGWVYEKAGEYHKAEEAHKTALKIRKKLLGTYNPDVATSLNSLGWVYEKTGNMTKQKKF